MQSLKLPDVTLAQLLAAFTWIVGTLVNMGVTDNETSKVIIEIGVTVIAAAWKVGDAIIRNGRAQIAAAAIHQGSASVKQTRV